MPPPDPEERRPPAAAIGTVPVGGGAGFVRPAGPGGGTAVGRDFPCCGSRGRQAPGAAEEVRAGDAAAPSLDPATIAANNTEFEPEPAPVAPPKPKPVEPPKPKVEAPPAPKPEPKPVVEEKAAPTGKAYVVQLGALKNADKVNEIVGKLRGAGYRVYTSPSTPVQGKITRILVGPDASKDKLKGSLGELKQLSGLSGVVMGYTPN